MIRLSVVVDLLRKARECNIPTKLEVEIERILDQIPNSGVQRVPNPDWTTGDQGVEYEVVFDGYAAGIACKVNGVESVVYLNPSNGGDGPDCFVYVGPDLDPNNATQTCCFIKPDGCKENE